MRGGVRQKLRWITVFAICQTTSRVNAPDLTESDGTGPVTVGLLDATGGGGRLARRLGGELLAGGLASGGLAGGLLGTSHFC